MFTPLSMKSSDTFEVVIKDTQGHEINYVRKALTLTMKQGKDVGPVNLIVDDLVVGGKSRHTLSFKAPAPIYDGFLLIVLIPEEA